MCGLGLGPIGQMSARIAAHHGATVYAVDKVPERLEMARRHGITVVNRSACDDVPAAIRDLTGGRGPDSVIDAVRTEAHGSPGAEMAQKMTGLLPKDLSEPLLRKVGVDRLAALMDAIQIVRRGGTISLSGVYGGMTDPLPMLVMFRQGHLGPHGPGPREALGRRHHAPPDRRRRPARRVGPRHPQTADRRRPDGLLDVPAEEGRRHQGRPRAVAGTPAGVRAPVG